MKRLNIIGCGKVGRTVGRLWAQGKVFDIGDILNRSKESSASAVQFIGAGQVVAGIEVMSPADVFLWVLLRSRRGLESWVSRNL